jgi:hypothetical protein
MKLPTNDALAPIATKTVAKPATKVIADRTTLRQAAAGMFSSLSSLIDVPARKQRYGGTSGRTQGLANDNNPATSAPKKLMSRSMPACTLNFS